jgi:hypothetical protein
MTTPYTLSVFRYIHDTATEEFVNIGVAVFSKEVKFHRARCTNRYGRVTEFFDRIDGERFRQLTRYIENQIVAVGDRLPPQVSRNPQSKSCWRRCCRLTTREFSFRLPASD